MASHKGEDQVIARLLPDIEKGFYIDVGANDPLTSSNSHPFYLKGWRGIDIEPIPFFAEKLRTVHPENYVIECAVASCNIDDVMLHVPDVGQEHWEIATLRYDIAQSHSKAGRGKSWSTVVVNQRTLNTLLHIPNALRDPNKIIDFMSLDVEGYEEEAFKGFDMRKWRPRVLCVEATYPSTDIPTWDEWEHYVLDANYTFVKFDGCNRFYVRKEDEFRLKYVSSCK